MPSRIRSTCLLAVLAALLVAAPSRAEPPAPKANPTELLAEFINFLGRVAAPPLGTRGHTLAFHATAIRAKGIPAEAGDREIEFRFSAPDRLRLSADIAGNTIALARDRDTLWIHAPTLNIGVLARSGIPRFSADPDHLDTTTLPQFRLDQTHLALLPLLLSANEDEPRTIRDIPCRTLRLTPRSGFESMFGFRPGDITIWLSEDTFLPQRIRYKDGDTDILVELRKVTLTKNDAKIGEDDADTSWSLSPEDDDKIETVPLGHLVRFAKVTLSGLDNKIPTLGPATGKRHLVRKFAGGRLEDFDGTKVLFLRGTPEQMGRQHGKLMAEEGRNLVDRMLYGVGIGSSFAKGRWFFGEIEEAQSRLLPHMDDRYLREMDALAEAADIHPQEARLTNFFPELFHCSGFAVFGKATAGGTLYHGRVLDYLRGLGLEQNAVVIVVQPDEGNAWVNLGYAGFVGTVTAMNEKHIAIGEMGGRGQGNWDGKPMAQLMREVMEKANSLEEAVEIMRKGPRTCEYYYVISDANSNSAVGIAATPDSFEVIRPGESHPKLPTPVEDSILMSEGKRYQELANRVRTQFGAIDSKSALDLMTRPVCMESNIQSVLFAPKSLDFWVANADSKNVASHTRYTKYNLRDLLDSKPAEPLSR